MFIGCGFVQDHTQALNWNRKKIVTNKGPSINDVSPKGEGGGYKKCPKRRRLLVDLRRQGEGGYPKNLKFGETSFMDGPLTY